MSYHATRPRYTFGAGMDRLTRDMGMSALALTLIGGASLICALFPMTIPSRVICLVTGGIALLLVIQGDWLSFQDLTRERIAATRQEAMDVAESRIYDVQNAREIAWIKASRKVQSRRIFATNQIR